MRVRADLGCIQESRMLPRLILDGNTTVRWEEKYAISPLEFELPECGTEKKDLSCPICGGNLKLKISSLARLHLLFTLAFWFVTLVVAGLAVLLFLINDENMRFIGMIVAAVAAALAVCSLAFMFLNPDHLVKFPDVLQLARDDACETNDYVGFSGRKGHKLFKIRGG